MIVAALVDLGVPPSVVTDALAKVDVRGYHVHFGSRERSGIVATSFDVHVEDEQPPRSFATIRALIETSSLDLGIRNRAINIFTHLAHAEARVHRIEFSHVHFHEVGAVDSIVDIVGASAAFEFLGADVLVSPLPMGRGFTKAAHGTLPLPAPATVESLRGFPTYDGGLPFEFVTPTGAAIVGSVARPSATWPSLVTERTGFGAGTATLEDRPNVLRVLLGTLTTTRIQSSSEASFAIVEANLDDATGENIGHAMNVLLREGALDAWATPITMKKGRPAVTLSALTELAGLDRIQRILLRETTTLGVRYFLVGRMELSRRIETVHTEYGDIPIKVAETLDGPIRIKPEYDFCAEASSRSGAPLETIRQAAEQAWRAKNVSR